MSTKTLRHPSPKPTKTAASPKLRRAPNTERMPSKNAASSTLKPAAVKVARTRKAAPPRFNLDDDFIDWDTRIETPPRKSITVMATIRYVGRRPPPASLLGDDA